MVWSRKLSVVGCPLAAVLLVAGCAGRQADDTTADRAPDPPSVPDGEATIAVEEAPSEEEAPGEPLTSGEAACQAYENDSDAKPLSGGIAVGARRCGGGVVVCAGAAAEQMEVELVLEMAGIGGYEDYVCGTAVVVWVPGFECGEEGVELARRIEAETTMSHLESACFRLDEVRLRIREACERGWLSEEVCQ